MMSAPESLPVFIRDVNGGYLALLADNWEFTADRSLAYIFDYHADDVPAQLEQAQREFGAILIATPVDPQLAGERCDECHRVVHSYETHFDGSRFLCPACASHPTHQAA
jgi:hypothetical protein